MIGLNRVQLIGFLGVTPEMSDTPGGNQVCNFRMAVTRSWKTDDGERKEATEWFNVEAWGRLGEICQQYLDKGSLVFLEGRLQTNKYEQNGSTRYFTKVVASRMQMLDRKEASPA